MLKEELWVWAQDFDIATFKIRLKIFLFDKAYKLSLAQVALNPHLIMHQ